MNDPRSAGPGDRSPLRRLRLAWGAAIALGAASPLALGAQAPGAGAAPEDLWEGSWLTIAVGVGGEGLALVGGISVPAWSGIVSARLVTTGDWFGSELLDVGVLYGQELSRGMAHASFGAGVAWVHSSEKGNAPGLPLEVQISLRPGFGLGFGVYGFANLNPKRSFHGVAIMVQLMNAGARDWPWARQKGGWGGDVRR